MKLTPGSLKSAILGNHGSHGSLPRWLYYKFYHRYPYGLPQIAFPSTIEVELTNDCNMSCPHCPRNTMTRQIGYMDFALFKKIVDEVSEHPNCYLRLVGLGEPSLHPDLVSILSYTRQHRITTEFVTNGQLLYELTPEEVIESGIAYLGISIDGFDARSYEKRRPGGDYGSLQTKVAELWTARQRMKRKTPLIKIRHVVYPKDTKADLEAYRAFWFSYADMVGFNKYTPTGRQEFAPPYKKCRFIKWEVKVDWDGKTPLCRFQNNIRDQEIVGNVRMQSIAEIWANQRMREARQAHAEGHLKSMEYCKFCQKIQAPGDRTVWK